MPDLDCSSSLRVAHKGHVHVRITSADSRIMAKHLQYIVSTITPGLRIGHC